MGFNGAPIGENSLSERFGPAPSSCLRSEAKDEIPWVSIGARHIRRTKYFRSDLLIKLNQLVTKL
jgi:hypothetical protein